MGNTGKEAKERIRLELGDITESDCQAIVNAANDAAMTTGGSLKARHVIHAASMQLGGRTSEANLRSSVHRSLEIADQQGLKSVALPAVGAGIAGFPLGRCAEVMLEVACDHLATGGRLEQIVFVLFDQRAYDAFREVYDRQ